MPRKSKPRGHENGEAPAAEVASNGNGHAAQPQAVKRSRPSRKKTSKTKLTSDTAATEVSTANPAQISDEAIRMRAYFIAEERVRLAQPGNPETDWLEARRQLLAEARLA